MRGFLHYLFLYTDLNKARIIICSNSNNKKVNSILKLYYDNGLISKLIFRKNKAGVRGSVNHGEGILECLPYIENDVILLDCDVFILSENWVQRLKDTLNQYDMFGIRQKRHGYVHPSCCIIKQSELLKHKNRILGYGDCLEGLSGVIKAKGYLDLFTCVVKSKTNDDDLGSFYGIGDRKIVFHCWGGSRYSDDGMDYYSAEEYKKLLYHIDKLYVADYVAIIPTYGELDDKKMLWIYKDLSEVCETIYIDGTGDMKKHNDIRICETPDICKQKSVLMNYGFYKMCAMKYIFHDRDIIMPNDFMDKIKNCKKEIFLNHSCVWYGDKAECKAPGGSLTINWDTFLKVGGFDTKMNGVGLEDREFLLRAKKVLNKQITRLPLDLIHIEHKRRLQYDSYKSRIKRSVLKGTLDIKDRRHYIWDNIKEWGGKAI